MVTKFVDESRNILRFSDVANEPRRMLPPIQGYEKMPLVSLEQAVDPLVSIVPEVERMAWTVKQSCIASEDGLTDDESASIMLYTMEWEPQDKSFHAILNTTLQTANRTLLRPWFPYLRLIMTSLAKLPSDTAHLIVHRGVKLDLSALYPTGSTVVWWGFSSCTMSLDILNDERFLGQNGTRTLFTIDCYSGKSIRQHSFYPEEQEVLLPPARQFQVMGCLNQSNGLHIIHLKEIQPRYPLINDVPSPPSTSSNARVKQNLVSPLTLKAVTIQTEIKSQVSLRENDVSTLVTPQVSLVSTSSKIQSHTSDPTQMSITQLIYQTSKASTPVQRTTTPPTCNNPNFQSYNDALYFDPVIVFADTLILRN